METKEKNYEVAYFRSPTKAREVLPMKYNPNSISQMLFYAQGMSDALQKPIFVVQFSDQSLQATTELLKLTGKNRLVANISPNVLPK